MELDLAKLALDGMRLDLGGARSLSLGPSGPATGRLQTGPEEIRIEAQGPNPIILRELSWPIGNGRLDSSGETVTTGTELENRSGAAEHRRSAARAAGAR